MQILEIVLYGYKNEKRVISFELGKVNIITGKSATGKSALIQIVDYCLGRESCLIPAGVIRKKVAWYGVLLQVSGGKVFIARENPKAQMSTSKCYVERGVDLISPTHPPTAPNSNTGSIEEMLTGLLGISSDSNDLSDDQTKPPLAANFRHALNFCFQQQSEIASNLVLFHRQAESFLELAQKVTLPYFLGAVREDYLALEYELEKTKKELRRLDVELKEAEFIKGEGLTKGMNLVWEARQVGILEDEGNPKTYEELVALLSKTNMWVATETVMPDGEKIAQLKQERNKLEEELVDLNETLIGVRNFAKEVEGYGSETEHQEFRLESIGLFESLDQADCCPLCFEKMKIPIPTVKAVKEAVSRIRTSLDNLTREKPKLREHIEKLEKTIDEKRDQTRALNTNIETMVTEREEATRGRNQNVRCGRILGRISLWLDSVKITDENELLKKRIGEIKKKLKGLENLLTPVHKDERLNSIVNRLSQQMTAWSNELKLEHSNNPVRLDPKALTIVVDTKDGPITLQKMGSGENWVGYHLIAHLALHMHFVQNSRPVPRFLFIDQPSQVYYPSEKDPGDGSIKNDEDRVAVSRMFNLMFNFVKNNVNDFQIIVTDHADLNEQEFQDSVRQRWRGGDALIPEQWSAENEGMSKE